MGVRTARMVTAVLAGVMLAASAVGHAGASTAGLRAGGPHSVAQQQKPPDGALDGFRITCLPAGLGANVSRFAYEFEGVRFRTQVWETGPDEHGAYRTDLNVMVLRGEILRDVEALREYLTFYQERDPRHWRLERFRMHGQPGYLGDDQVFWLVRPGVAVLVKVYDDRFTQDDVLEVAGGISEVG